MGKANAGLVQTIQEKEHGTFLQTFLQIGEQPFGRLRSVSGVTSYEGVNLPDYQVREAGLRGSGRKVTQRDKDGEIGQVFHFALGGLESQVSE
jgi:hypothetical protein